MDLEGVTKAAKVFKVKKCVRPWEMRRASLQDKNGMWKSALEMEERAAGDIREFETYVQWVKEGDKNTQLVVRKKEEEEYTKMLDYLRVEMLAAMMEEAEMMKDI